eukprot:7340337-Prymnesium_polylepis.1
MWSLGICVFALLLGFFPLDEAKETDWRFPKLKAAQARGESSVATIARWYLRRVHLSDDARNLLDGLLQVDPRRRASIGDVLEH